MSRSLRRAGRTSECPCTSMDPESLHNLLRSPLPRPRRGASPPATCSLDTPEEQEFILSIFSSRHERGYAWLASTAAPPPPDLHDCTAKLRRLCPLEARNWSWANGASASFVWVGATRTERARSALGYNPPP